MQESLFFEYKIKNLGNSYAFIRFSQREHIQMYVSTMSLYPSQKEHKWAFGDLPLSVVQKSQDNPFMRDIFTEASPFEIEDKIVYYREFKNPQKYRANLDSS